MFRQWLITFPFASLCVTLAYGQAPTPNRTAVLNSEYTNRTDFEFLYHSYTNLFLTIHHDECYFTYIEPGLGPYLHGQYRDSVELQLRSAILHRDGTRVQQSTLDDVRTTYGDLLADYECSNKTIYNLQLDTSGQYLYLERDLGHAGSVAELISPALVLNDAVCFQFTYSLHGHADLGAIAVFARASKENQVQEQKLWELSGEQGEGWHNAEVSIRPQAETGWSTQIIIRATRGNYLGGDFRIDNFTSSSGLCLASHLDCDFENGMCEWEQSYHDKRDWTRHHGPTPTPNTGPDKDHTLRTDNGHYLYFESNNVNIGDTADLLSPRLDLTAPMCLKFWYNMYGADVGTLKVLIKNVSTGQETMVYQRLGNQGNMWLQAVMGIIPLGGPGYRTEIIIRATRGNSIEADIAIDDITGSTGSCISSPS